MNVFVTVCNNFVREPGLWFYVFPAISNSLILSVCFFQQYLSYIRMMTGDLMRPSATELHIQLKRSPPQVGLETGTARSIG